MMVDRFYTATTNKISHISGDNLGKHYECIQKVYTFAKRTGMKTLSLKLDDRTFEEAEKITAQLKLARNRYINEAVNLYNQFNKKRKPGLPLLRERD